MAGSIVWLMAARTCHGAQRASETAVSRALEVPSSAGGSVEELQFPGPPLSSRGVAVGDLDGDGDPDLAIASCGDRLRLWRNDAGNRGRYVVLELEGASPNTSAFGTSISARVGGRTLVRQVAGGGSYAYHGDARVYLGVGDGGTIDEIEVRWPDGAIETATGLDGGEWIHWRQGAGIVERR